jgi:hypothetical protein
MARGRKRKGGSNQAAPLSLAAPSSGVRAVQVLPDNLVRSLETTASAPPVTPAAPPGTGDPSADAIAVLRSLVAQVDAQIVARPHVDDRLPTSAVQPPAGMSESRTRKMLADLRTRRLVGYRQGRWYVCDEGRDLLAVL